MLKKCSKCGKIAEHYRTCRWCKECLKAYNKQRYNYQSPLRTEAEFKKLAKEYNSDKGDDYDVSLLFVGLKRMGII